MWSISGSLLQKMKTIKFVQKNQFIKSQKVKL